MRTGVLFSDATAQLGGPLIKEKLRFYTSWRDWRIHRNVPNFFEEGYTSGSGQPCVVQSGTSPCTPKTENTDLFSGLVNLSYELNSKNRINALWTRQTYWKPNRNASAQIQPDSTWIEDDVFSIYQGKYSSTISSNALLDVRGAVEQRSRQPGRPQIGRELAEVHVIVAGDDPFSHVILRSGALAVGATIFAPLAFMHKTETSARVCPRAIRRRVDRREPRCRGTGPPARPVSSPGTIA